MSSHLTSTIVIENILLLIKAVLRIDPIVKELNNLIEGTKVDGE